jgi:hypothetical protein
MVAIGVLAEISLMPANVEYVPSAAMHALVNPRRFSW